MIFKLILPCLCTYNTKCDFSWQLGVSSTIYNIYISTMRLQNFFFCYFLCMLHIALNLIEQLNCFFRPIFNSNDSVTSNYLVDY